MDLIKKELLFDMDRDNINEWIDEIHIHPHELARIHNWAKINNEYFYMKKCENYNEFIGEIISNELNLKTANYSLVRLIEPGKENKLFYKSKNFYNPNKQYCKTFDLFRFPHDDIMDDFKLILTKENYYSLKDDKSKLFSNDIFMRQEDRCSVNVIYEKEKDMINLGPVFDYSNSLGYSIDEYNKYINTIYDIEFDKKSLYEVFRRYPKLRTYLKKVLEIDILKKLKNKLQDNDVLLTSSEEIKYEQELEKSRELVKTILNK